jgi:hypothetical protein
MECTQMGEAKRPHNLFSLFLSLLSVFLARRTEFRAKVSA